MHLVPAPTVQQSLGPKHERRSGTQDPRRFGALRNRLDTIRGSSLGPASEAPHLREMGFQVSRVWRLGAVFLRPGATLAQADAGVSE